MKRFLLVICAALAWAWSPAQQSTALPGSFTPAYQDLSFQDPNLSSPTVDVRVYYPSTTPGPNQPLATGVFPVVAFGHGFNLNYLDYEEICQHLASWGYLVITPDVQNGFNVDHFEYAQELGACIQWLKDEGQNSNSVFFNQVAATSGVFGHSMGGGASGLVPGVYPAVDAVSGLASAETSPSAITALGSYSGPYQVISGDQDNVAPENGNQADMYNAAQGEKQWVSIAGGAHCKFTDGPTICDFVSSPGSIDRDDQIFLSKKYTTAFFNYYLQGDSTALTFLCGDSVQAEQARGTIALTTNLNCSVVAQAEPVPDWELWPNPATEALQVKGLAEFRIYDVWGREMGQYSLSQGEVYTVKMDDWSAGWYLLKSPSGGHKAFLKR